MLTPIVTSGKQSGINTLNTLIRDFDKKKLDSQGQAMLLAQIHSLSEQLFEELQTQHDPNFVDKDVDNFLNWYSSNAVIQEFSQFNASVLPGASGEKSILELAQQASSLPTVKQWTKQTTPRNFLSKRNALYETINPLLETVHQQRADYQGSPEKKSRYYNALDKLKNQIFVQLNHHSDINNKPLAQQRLRTLLNSVLFEMNQLFEGLEEKKNEHEQQKKVAAALLGFSAATEKALLELSNHLSKNQTDIIPGFEIRRLGAQGGGNNQNWAATDLETGKTYLIRLADGHDFKPKTINNLRSDPEINAFLTQEYLHAVSPISPTGNNYVISVSEFCPNGDLSHYQQQQANEMAEPEHLADCALKKTMAVAEFIALLAKKGYGHPDIKAENFLLNDSLQLAVSDIKFIRPLRSDGTLEKYEEANTTYSFAAPEYLRDFSLKVQINMDKFSSYQLGVMLYDLLTAQNSEDKLEWSKKLQLAACDPEIKNTAEALDFSADIFNTPKGQMAKELIQAALQSDLQLRPGIDEFIARLNYIAPGIAETADAWPEATMGTSAQTCRNMKNNLLHMKNQGDAPDVSYEQGFKNM